MSETTDKDIEALRDNIEETRGRITGEIAAISDRLTPEHAREVARGKLMEAKDKVVGRVKSSAQEAMDTASRGAERLPWIVRDNPIPVAMITVGAGWLTVSAVQHLRAGDSQLELALEPGRGRLRQRRERAVAKAEAARERVGEAAERARSRIGSVAERTTDRIGGTVSSVKERAGGLAKRGRENASQMVARGQSAFDDNPLVFGGVCLLAGVGLGMLLPRTAREDRVLGRRRAQVVDRARHMAKDARDVAVDSAKEGLRAARDTAKREAEEHDLGIG